MGENISKIWLVAHLDNIIAIILCESLEFSVTERKENYFGDGESRVILESDIE